MNFNKHGCLTGVTLFGNWSPVASYYPPKKAGIKLRAVRPHRYEQTFSSEIFPRYGLAIRQPVSSWQKNRKPFLPDRFAETGPGLAAAAHERDIEMAAANCYRLLAARTIANTNIDIGMFLSEPVNEAKQEFLPYGLEGIIDQVPEVECTRQE